MISQRPSSGKRSTRKNAVLNAEAVGNEAKTRDTELQSQQNLSGYHDSQSTDKVKTRDGSGNIDFFPPAIQSRTVFDRRGGNYPECLDISIRPVEDEGD